MTTAKQMQEMWQPCTKDKACTLPNIYCTTPDCERGRAIRAIPIESDSDSDRIFFNCAQCAAAFQSEAERGARLALAAVRKLATDMPNRLEDNTDQYAEGFTVGANILVNAIDALSIPDILKGGKGAQTRTLVKWLRTTNNRVRRSK